DGDHVLGHVHRWRFSNGRFEGCLIFLPARAGRNDDWHRIRIIRAGKLHLAADAGYGAWHALQSTTVCRSMVDRCAVSRGGSRRVVIPEPPPRARDGVKIFDIWKNREQNIDAKRNYKILLNDTNNLHAYTIMLS